MKQLNDILKKLAALLKAHLQKDLSLLAGAYGLFLAWIRGSRKILLTITGTLVLAAVVFIWVFEFTPMMAEFAVQSRKAAGGELSPENQVALKKELQKSARTIKTLDASLDRLSPRTNFLVINTNENHFYLYRGSRVLRDGVCSTGSYTLLQGGENQQWVFKTPKGMFRIQGKREAPVWKKPDWAFVEEGLPIPSVNHPTRFEYGVLGDYALALGDGYLIHGTLYKRFLGLPVTHGCVRLNDDDLYAVYSTLEPGSKVFIF